MMTVFGYIGLFFYSLIAIYCHSVLWSSYFHYEKRLHEVGNKLKVTFNTPTYKYHRPIQFAIIAIIVSCMWIVAWPLMLFVFRRGPEW